MKEAMLYEKVPEQRVRCHLCAHQCLIEDGRKGLCLVRKNRERDTLYSGIRAHDQPTGGPGREKAVIPFLSRLQCLFDGHPRLQFPLPVVSELGDLANAA